MSVTSARQHQRLVEWNDTSKPRSEDLRLHQLVATQADRTPAAVAVVEDALPADSSLTYRQLTERAGLLAGRLETLGVGPETLVGLYLDRSHDTVVGQLAILAAGGAYLPLDPSYPHRRLASTLENARPRLILTADRLLDQWPGATADLVSLDSQGRSAAVSSERSGRRPTKPIAHLSSDHPAYVLTTSGSTGRPRCVAISHRAICNHRLWMQSALPLRTSDRVLHKAPLGFDASVWEIWAPLVAGAQVVVARPDGHRDPEYLVEVLRRQRITVMHAVPSLLRMLVEHPDFKCCRDLRRVCCGGEALSVELKERFFALGLDAELIQLYGPTEATIQACVAVCENARSVAPVPLGRPIDNARIALFDPKARPISDWHAGEIHIGGAGLARGYLGEPRLSAERFVPDVTGVSAGQRLFKTGDLARYQRDGQLCFQGRFDQQVKIRGFRVELGDVEALLRQHPRVEQAVAMVHEVASPGPRSTRRDALVAYVVPTDEPVSTAQLEAHLRERAPDFMIPAIFITLDSLPLNAHGKVDRLALAGLPAPRRTAQVPPSTPLQKDLAAMFCEVLGIPRIGVTETFLELGGDSIQAARLINQLQARLGETLYVSALFEAPTVARLADYLERHYAAAVARIWDRPRLPGRDTERRIRRADASHLRRLIVPLAARPGPPERKNPPAVFVLAPPRSGSTLFRIMLAGHPQLFSPPAPGLLMFNTLKERTQTCVGRLSFLREGTLRAIMEIRECPVEEAERIMADRERRGWSVQRFYRQLQEWIGERILVDKTTSYSHDLTTLRRAESDFEKPLYLHLVRHPCAMIHSFREARIDRVFRFDNPFSPRQLAELVWLICHQNILRFLSDVPEERQHRVRFEEMVKRPEEILGGVCRFLGLSPHPDVVDPYCHPERRMVDGLYPESRMIGDYKFRQHGKLDPGVADRWRSRLKPDALGIPTRHLARELGYGSTVPREIDRPADSRPMKPIPRAAPLGETASGATAYPLSFAQRRLWFLEQMNPGDPVHNTASAWQLEGTVDPSWIERGLTEILRRHGSLRTSFIEIEDRPVQQVAADGRVRLTIADLDALDPRRRRRQAQRLAHSLAIERFDLERGPVLRAALIRSTADRALLVLALHHIVSDGWSKRVLSRELSTWARAVARGQRPKLPRLPIQYADFSIWQRRRLAVRSQELAEPRRYWRRQLAGASRLALPADRPHRRSYRGARRTMTLDSELVGDLRRLGQESGATLYMTLLAAFLAFLHRLTGQRDLVVGSPVANRHRAETENLIGTFVNMLAMRARIRQLIHFRQFLDQVRQLAIEAYAHQEVPFEQIVEELSPDRDPHRHPLFQVTFALQQDPRAELVLPGLKVSPQRLETRTVRFDLEWHLTASSGDDFSGVLAYSTDLFDTTTITRWSAGLKGLLRAILANPDRELTDLPMLTPAQRQQLLIEWNDRRIEWNDESLHRLFEKQVAHDPERSAVVWQQAEGQIHNLSYQRLNRRANRLAQRLAHLEVAAESRVTILLDRGPALVVAMLGILKAGAAYLPLDPASPRRRLTRLLADSGSRVLIIDSEIEPPDAGGQFLVRLRGNGEVVRSPHPEPDRGLSKTRGDHPAYALYTSGSTGQPKGVVISHAAIHNHMQWMQRDLPLTAEDRVLQKTPATFDASVWEFWAPLMVGGCLVLAPTEAHRDPAALVDAIHKHQISILQVVPSLLRELLELDDFARCEALRRVYCGGEALTADLVKSYVDRGPSAELLNVYGPTEATIHASFEPGVTSTGSRSQATLGRPVANARLYLASRYLEPVPIGAAGEILIAGRGLARGYLGRPALTAESFIPDPIRPRGRLYRTGDLARQLADGRLEFLGRRDHQVKLRGQRIELGEIEATLLEHPGIRRAVVLATDSQDVSVLDQRLIAFVVLAGSGSSLSSSTLRRFLGDRLPAGWVPSRFAFEDSLPLNSSGKIDRRALARHARDVQNRSVQEPNYAPPRTPVEEILASIWARVLSLPRVGIRDNFFDLGGHSLLATRVVSRIRQSFAEELPLRTIFESPTLADLAARLEQILDLGAGLQLPPIVPAERSRDLPLSFAQRRLWFLHQLEPTSPAYNMSLIFDVEGPLDISALELSLRHLMERHESLRTTFLNVAGRPRQRITPSTVGRLALIDLGALPNDVADREAARWLDRLANLPFDLERGPLIRTVLLRQASDRPTQSTRHVLFSGQHHIISDGWSLGVFHRELSELYRAAQLRRPALLPELEVQYPDYAAWQRSWPAAILAPQLEYWRQRLADLPQLELPTDRPRPDVSSYQGARRSLHLDAEKTLALKRLASDRGCSLFMTLLAGFMVLLGRACGRNDVAVGSPIANRNRAEIEGLLGFFVNSLVLRADLSGNPEFRQLLAQVRETSLGAYAHQDLPFERLVEELSPRRQTTRHPLFQISFALQNAPAPSLELTDLTVSRRSLGLRAARFDLEVVWREASPGSGPRGLDGAIIYRSDLFDASTIDRLSDHLLTLLQTVAERPNTRLTELPLLRQAQRHQLLHEWSATPGRPEAGVDGRPCLHHLFEARVQHCPDAEAVRWPQGQLTFRQLNEQADRLAGHLRARGAGPETVVGLFLERSPEMVVAVLGVLKAGAAYLPLSLSTPPHRLATLLREARARIVLTHEQLHASLPETKHILLLPEALLEPAEARISDPEVRGDNAAYVLFTSGSTGRPKGVVVSHRAAAAYLGWAVEAYRVASGHRGASLCSDLAFDLTLTSLFAPLLAGRALDLLPENSDMADLAELLQEAEALSLLKVTPSHLAALRHAWVGGPIDNPTTLVIGGEALSHAELDFWRRNASSTRIVNEYGPTEAVVACSAHRVPTMAPGTGAVPIGRPIGKSRLFLLDANHRPVAHGMPGELYVSGNLARGYLHRARETASVFLPDPVARIPGSRLYRTGDRARHLSDGNLVFLGRTDDQIKLRGFRIEPGEIEATLEEHPDVISAAVLAHSSPERLVAYILADRKRVQDLLPRLQDHLSGRLPSYMRPSTYNVLATLPLAASGKVDRHALAALDGERPASDHPYVAPRTETEERLAAIWSAVLDIERVGVHDNFFEIGGDSILSIQIIARARQAGLKLAPRDLFDHQTIAELARQAGTFARVHAAQCVVTGPVALTPIQYWFFERCLPEPWHYNWTAIYRAREALNANILARALNQLMRHHDVLRTRFEHRAEIWHQRVVGPDEALPFCHLDLSRLTDYGDARVAIEKASAQLQASLDLNQGPLLRMAWFDFRSTDSRLLLTVHHLVVDAISWQVLVEDLQSIYRWLAASQPVALPAKTTAFRTWSARLTKHARSLETGRELANWTALARMADDESLCLPLDTPGQGNPLSSSATVTTTLNADSTRRLLRDVPRAYRTGVDEILLTALLGAFGRWTGRKKLLVDLEGHGREEIFEDVDLSRTVGWFTTLFPVCLALQENGGPGEDLKSVKEQLRQVPRRGIGEGLLRYLSSSEAAEELRQASRPQVRFNYLGRRDAANTSPSLFALAPESTGASTSRRGERSHLLEIDAAIKARRLQLRWTYSNERHRRVTLERLARSFMDELETLIENCRLPKSWGRTPSDFPLAGLDQVRLDRLLSSLKAPRKIEDMYPCTPMQEGMLFHSLYAPDSDVYFEQSAWTLPATLDTDALRRAWSQVVERHAVLRTALTWKNLDRPLQIVYRHVELPWEELSPGQGSRFENLRNADLRRGFELERAPLMRLTLIRWQDGSYRLLWSTHHALLDGWSSARLRQEVWTLYESHRDGPQAELDPPVPYRDFVAWSESRDRTTAANFWRRMLAGFEPQPLPDLGPGDGSGLGKLKRQLSPAATSELESLARQQRLTLNTLVQGAWALMLARTSGRDDIVFGVTVTGRTPALTGSDGMVGLLINTLPLRVRPAEDHELWRWLSELQELNLEMRQHATTPLVEIRDYASAREEKAPRATTPAHQPLFEDIFLFQRNPFRAADIEHRLGVRRLRHTGRTNYPLVMTAIPGQRLRLELDFANERFGAVPMARALTHLCTLIEGMSSAKHLGNLPWLSRAERHQVLIEWNDTRIAAPDTSCLHRLFEHQAVRTPDRVALVFGQELLTFSSLERHAEKLARHLIDLGIGGGHYVPVLMHQRPEVPVAWLATMKTGAAFVPLDARWPEERIAGILDELEPEVVLVNDQRLAERWDGSHRVDLSKPAQSTPALRAPVSPKEPIYAIYTSGSTGRPKAAINTHSGVANRFRWMDRRFADASKPVVLQTTYFTFDSAVWQLFWPMIAGGRSVMPAERESYDPEALIAIIDRQRITFTDFVPSVFDLLIEQLERRTSPIQRLAYLRHLIVGGEAIHRATIARFAGLFPAVRLTNLYGPTETAIGVISHPVEGVGAGEIPIGRPIHNVAALVLDTQLAPVAVGETGEIHLGGLCVGLGYLGDARRSAEFFLSDPYSETGGKLYKTGDLARYGANGNIEFLGRIDRQVKIRGFRVAPEEIESQLAMHPAIQEAAIVVLGDDRERRLVGCLVANDVDEAQPVRTWLERRLPTYMVPSELIFFDDLPRTAAGKIDQNELMRRTARPPGGATVASRRGLSPRDSIERELAAIWSRILGRQRIGVRESFFTLGGHSLLAVRLMSVVERRLGVALPLASLFDQPTIEGQAGLLRRRRPPESSPLVALQRDGSSAPFFCVHPIGGHVMCYVDLARHLGEDQPFYGLQARGLDEPAQAHLDIPTMAADYLAAIRSLQPRGALRLGGWSMGGLVAYEMACQLRAQGQRVALLVLIDPAAPRPATAFETSISHNARFGNFSHVNRLQNVDWDPLMQRPPREALRLLYENARRAAIFEGPLGHSRLRVLYNLVRDQLASSIESGLEPRWRDLARRPNGEILDRLYDAAERGFQKGLEVDLPRLRDLYRLFECNLKAMYDFSPRRYEGDVMLLKTRNRDAGEATRGWDQLAARVEICELPGDHYSLVREPDVRHLADRLRHYLKRAACPPISSSRRDASRSGI